MKPAAHGVLVAANLSSDEAFYCRSQVSRSNAKEIANQQSHEYPSSIAHLGNSPRGHWHRIAFPCHCHHWASSGCRWCLGPQLLQCRLLSRVAHVTRDRDIIVGWLKSTDWHWWSCLLKLRIWDRHVEKTRRWGQSSYRKPLSNHGKPLSLQQGASLPALPIALPQQPSLPTQTLITK